MERMGELGGTSLRDRHTFTHGMHVRAEPRLLRVLKLEPAWLLNPPCFGHLTEIVRCCLSLHRETGGKNDLHHLTFV